MSDKKEGKRPDRVLRGPGGVRLAIWERTLRKEGDEFTVQSIAIEKTVKTADGFKSFNSFDARDLPTVAMLAGKAYELLCLRVQDGEGE